MTCLNMLKNLVLAKSIKLTLFTLLGVLLLSGVLFFYSTSPYTTRKFEFQSNIGNSLKVFLYNESAFNDPIPGCWYDSGDYIVFLHRNAETFYYLSLAYEQASSPQVKADIKYVLDRQSTCIDGMLKRNYKQFGDQGSHGINLPPTFSSAFYPRNNYHMRPGEGKDVYLLYSLSFTNLGDTKNAANWLKKAEEADTKTISENCCEGGPLFLTPMDYTGLTGLSGIEDVNARDLNTIWGVHFPALLSIKNGEKGMLSDMLSSVEERWTQHDSPFLYLGGNYDIAGTIALERMYAKKFNDHSFDDLASSLIHYLKGENQYHTDFTNYPSPYHPCAFFASCSLPDTLINGADSDGFDPKRNDIWRNTEIQLFGQAEYVLALVLYNNW